MIHYAIMKYKSALEKRRIVQYVLYRDRRSAVRANYI